MSKETVSSGRVTVFAKENLYSEVVKLKKDHHSMTSYKLYHGCVHMTVYIIHTEFSTTQDARYPVGCSEQDWGQWGISVSALLISFSLENLRSNEKESIRYLFLTVLPGGKKHVLSPVALILQSFCLCHFITLVVVLSGYLFI